MSPNANITALELSMNRVGMREYSQVEMQRYLRRKKYPQAEIDAAVLELVRRGLIDDGRYSRVQARHQAMRERGPMAILIKLKQKGVSIDVPEARRLFAENTDAGSELELVQRLVERRYADLDRSDRKAMARAYGALIRRGFSHEAVRQALAKSRLDFDESGLAPAD